MNLPPKRRGKPLGVQIEHVASVPLDINGNPVPPTPPLGVAKPPVIASYRVTIRVEHANELTFYAEPGMQDNLAKAAISDPGFWATALQAAQQTGAQNFDKASMAAALEALAMQARKNQPKKGPGGIIH